jgi:putative FmdB family regulatory protein
VRGSDVPLYEYQCDACGRRFEAIQKFSDPPIETCPTCQGAVQKLLSSPAIQFKGSGWYITDYARKDKSDTKDTKDSKGSKTDPPTKPDAPAGTSSKEPAKEAGKSDAKAGTTTASPAPTDRAS